MFKTIIIIEKSRIIREGLTSILKNNHICQRICSIETFDEFHLLKESSPDLIIINPDYVKEGIEKIKLKYHLSAHTLLTGLIYSYYPKEITESFNNLIYITDSEQNIINNLKHIFTQEQPERIEPERLTDREKDVLKLLLKGYANKEVADKLNISPHTVISHRKNIIEKTNIRSLAGLAVYAIMNNIADIEDIRE